MKRIEISCRELHYLLKENIEDIKYPFVDKEVKDLSWDDLMYILYYNSDNVLVYKEEDEGELSFICDCCGETFSIKDRKILFSKELCPECYI